MFFDIDSHSLTIDSNSQLQAQRALESCGRLPGTQGHLESLYGVCCLQRRGLSVDRHKGNAAVLYRQLPHRLPTNPCREINRLQVLSQSGDRPGIQPFGANYLQARSQRLLQLQLGISLLLHTSRTWSHRCRATSRSKAVSAAPSSLCPLRLENTFIADTLRQFHRHLHDPTRSIWFDSHFFAHSYKSRVFRQQAISQSSISHSFHQRFSLATKHLIH